MFNENRLCLLLPLVRFLFERHENFQRINILTFKKKRD